MVDTGRVRWPQSLLRKAALVGVGILLPLCATEIALRRLTGLGDPVLYSSNPLYGYRLQPNQDRLRLEGARVRVNNLALRANEDWDSSIRQRILFLGNSVTYGGSYISNDELFSALSTTGLAGFRSGNAGVNGWGVENVHGLIVRSEFLPATIYVSVFLEGDFYRGVTRIAGLPFWCRKPGFALQEVLWFYFYRANLQRYVEWQEGATEGQKDRVVRSAVEKLAEMEKFLAAQGFAHVLYITPKRSQVLQGEGSDKRVESFLREEGLTPIFLLDRLRSLDLPESEVARIFRDPFHLERYGHEVWAELMRRDIISVARSLDRSSEGSSDTRSPK